MNGQKKEFQDKIKKAKLLNAAAAKPWLAPEAVICDAVTSFRGGAEADDMELIC